MFDNRGVCQAPIKNPLVGCPLKKMLTSCAVAALALSAPAAALAGNGNGNGGANGNGVVVLTAPCFLSVGTSCLFQGNINLDNKLGQVDDAYNSQTPGPPTQLDLEDLGAAQKDTGFSNLHAGTITSDFLVSYYAVKGGDYFRLYQIAPTYTFNWSTAGLTTGGGAEPGVSHVVWFDPPGAIPEPATWALMIGGFGMAGALLRRRRRMQLA